LSDAKDSTIFSISGKLSGLVFGTHSGAYLGLKVVVIIEGSGNSLAPLEEATGFK